MVFAQGPIGLCATAGAKLMGASFIIGVESDPVRMKMAKQMGADVVLDPKQCDVVAEVKKLTGGGADVAIEALGLQETFENSLRCLRPGGTLSSLGVYSGKLQVPYDAFAAGIGDYKIVTTLCPGGKERMRRLMSMVQSGRFDPTPLHHPQLLVRPNRRGLRSLRLASRRRSESCDPAMTATTTSPTKTAGATERETHGAPLIKRFDEIGIEDIPLVGGKNASLGEMRRELTAKGVPVPDGFATTAAAYWHFLEKTKLKALIDDMLADLDVADIHELQKRSAKIRNAIMSAKLPQDLELGSGMRTRQLSAAATGTLAVAVGAAPRRKICPTPASRRAGNIPERARGRGAAHGVFALLRVALLERAISYRADKGYAHTKVARSPSGSQRMVRVRSRHFRRHFHLDTESGIS